MVWGKGGRSYSQRLFPGGGLFGVNQRARNRILWLQAKEICSEQLKEEKKEMNASSKLWERTQQQVESR